MAPACVWPRLQQLKVSDIDGERASRIRQGATTRPNMIRRLREISGGAMIALGIGLALAKRPAS
jgi:hypothetical protein